MMSPYEVLTLIVEFSIGLAGFTGIVSMFGGSKRKVTDIIRFRVMILLATSLAPGFGAFVALTLPHVGFDDAATLRTSCIAFAVFTLLWGFGIYRHVTLNGAEIFGALESGTPFYHQFYRFAGSWALVPTLFAAVQFINALSFGQHAFGIFLGSLVLMLLLGALQFVQVVQMLLREE